MYCCIILFATAVFVVPTASAQTQCGLGVDDPSNPNEVHRFPVAPTDFTFQSTNADVGWQVAASSQRDAADDGTGHIDPVRIWYTSTIAGQANYASGANGTDTNQGSAVSSQVTVPGGAWSVRVVFASRYEIESRDPNSYDQMSVRLRIDDGSWSTVCRLNPSTAYNGWTHETACSDGTAQGKYPCPTDDPVQGLPKWENRSVVIDGAGGHNVRIGFVFDTVDGADNTGLGWMVTDVQVVRTGPLVIGSVPTLSEWSLIAIVSLLLLAGVVLVHRRKPQ